MSRPYHTLITSRNFDITLSLHITHKIPKPMPKPPVYITVLRYMTWILHHIHITPYHVYITSYQIYVKLHFIYVTFALDRSTLQDNPSAVPKYFFLCFTSGGSKLLEKRKPLFLVFIFSYRGSWLSWRFRHTLFENT